jgi:predicted dienelactone hydrolase
MFSPGWGCPAYFTNFIAARLASHGFVVAVIYHYGDGCWSWEPWDHLAVASYNRPRDVSFLLTDLLQKNQAAGKNWPLVTIGC